MDAPVLIKGQRYVNCGTILNRRLWFTASLCLLLASFSWASLYQTMKYVEGAFEWPKLHGDIVFELTLANGVFIHILGYLLAYTIRSAIGYRANLGSALCVVLASLLLKLICFAMRLAGAQPEAHFAPLEVDFLDCVVAPVLLTFSLGWASSASLAGYIAALVSVRSSR